MLDCDGVLVRSEPANIAYYNRMFSHFSLREVTSSDEASRKLLHTLSTPQVIAHFFPPAIQAEAGDFAERLDFLEFSDLLMPEPGWKETLADLKGVVSICVATNRGQSAGKVLEAVGLCDRVERIFTVKMVRRPKPAPDLLELALATFGVGREKALYVGDSGLDREAARAAGVTFVGFRTDGDYRIDSPDELKSVIHFIKTPTNGERNRR